MGLNRKGLINAHTPTYAQKSKTRTVTIDLRDFQLSLPFK